MAQQETKGKMFAVQLIAIHFGYHSKIHGGVVVTGHREQQHSRHKKIAALVKEHEKHEMHEMHKV